MACRVVRVLHFRVSNFSSFPNENTVQFVFYTKAFLFEIAIAIHIVVVIF